MRQIGSGTYIRAIAAILAVTALAVPAMAQTERDPERYGHELRSVLPGFLFHARDASWIGVAIDDIGNGDGGATVTDITDGSPAAHRQAWRFIRPDGALTLENLDIVRDGAPRSIRVTLPDAGR